MATTVGSVGIWFDPDFDANGSNDGADGLGTFSRTGKGDRAAGEMDLVGVPLGGVACHSWDGPHENANDLIEGVVIVVKHDDFERRKQATENLWVEVTFAHWGRRGLTALGRSVATGLGRCVPKSPCHSRPAARLYPRHRSHAFSNGLATGSDRPEPTRSLCYRAAMPANQQSLVLIILDGWGIAPVGPGNAISAVPTPHLDALAREGVTSTLDAAGEAVGLPDGQIGNSEVGHLNLGAGFRVLQDLPRIDTAIRDGSFDANPALVGAIRHALAAPARTLHLIGLVSHGGVHSHARHLDALIRLAAKYSIDRVAVHVILDGRDTPPRQALEDLPGLEATLHATGAGRIASVSGRYYAMDRDKRWDRVARAYATIVTGSGPRFASAAAVVEDAYAHGTNDEFVEPAVVGEPIPIADGDAVVVFNFRADRARELCHALLLPDFDAFPRTRVAHNVHVVTFGEYEAGLPVTGIAFPPQHVDAPFARVVSDAGLAQCHIAETEKYAHVTFFLNGGIEVPFAGEDRVLVPSPKVATYDLQPEMSARELARAAVSRIETHDDALLVMNFANGDMVGHTGVLSAVHAAVAVVDESVGIVAAAARTRGRIVAVTSDHGNAEVMVDPNTGGPWTAHTTNPVPLIIVGLPNGTTLRPRGELSNVAPTLLRLMGLPIPPEMTSPDLIL